MSKSNTFENLMLLLFFNNTAMANVGGGTISGSVAGNVYVSLHTADPNEPADQTTSETTYTGYARQPVARSSAGWTVTANSVSPVANIVFPISTSGTPSISHFGVGTLVSGAGVMWYSGLVQPPITVSTVVPQTLTTGSTITED
jgi:hypothetical protein